MQYSTKEKSLNIFVNLVIGIIGAWFIFNPTIGINLYRFVISAILIVTALSSFYSYRKSVDHKVQFMAQTIICGGLGLVFIFKSSMTETILGLVLLAWVVFDGVIQLKMAKTYQQFKLDNWWIILAYGIGAMLLGLWIVFNLSASGRTFIMLTGFFSVVRSSIAIFDAIYCKNNYYRMKGLHNK